MGRGYRTPKRRTGRYKTRGVPDVTVSKFLQFFLDITWQILHISGAAFWFFDAAVFSSSRTASLRVDIIGMMRTMTQ